MGKSTLEERGLPFSCHGCRVDARPNLLGFFLIPVTSNNNFRFVKKGRGCVVGASLMASLVDQFAAMVAAGCEKKSVMAGIGWVKTGARWPTTHHPLRPIHTLHVWCRQLQRRRLAERPLHPSRRRQRQPHRPEETQREGDVGVPPEMN